MHNTSKKDDIELPLLQKGSKGSMKDNNNGQDNVRKTSDASWQSKPKYLDVNLFNRLAFGWVSRIMDSTGAAAFQQNMHYDLRQSEDCGSIATKFFYEWERAKNKKFPFLRAQFNSFSSLIWQTQLLALAQTLLNFSGPVLVSRIIVYTQNENPDFDQGLWLIALFVFSRLCIILVSAQSSMISSLLHLRIVKATRSLVFTKFLKFPLKRNQEYTTGSVMNNMLVDAANMSKISFILPQIIQLPITLLIGVYLIYISIGLAFIGVALTIVVVTFLTSFLTKQNSKQQKEIMTTKDSRIKRTTEIFTGIKYIKMCGSETKFLDIIMADRDKELALLSKRYSLSCLHSTLTWLTPTLLNLSAFGAYLLADEELTAEKAFVVLSTLFVVQGPIFGVGSLLNELIQSQVSLSRIQNFLFAEEVSTSYISHATTNNSPYAIKIANGNFAWVDENAPKKEPKKAPGKPENDSKPNAAVAPPPKKPADIEKGPEGPPKLVLVLKDINMKVKNGSFVAILGDVGSGKSSLFHALFGEMRHLPESPPSIEIDGSVAYVSQKPWVLNDTVKDNILFDNPYDEDLYKEAIRGSCLEQDIKTLIKKDETEIGEKGVNLSGGQKARIALARAIYANKDIYLLDDPLSAVDAHVGKHILEECLVGQLRNKTRVLVTHKLESLKFVDFIYIFKDGVIVAEGNLDAIRKSSYYQEIEESNQKAENKRENKKENNSKTGDQPARPSKKPKRQDTLARKSSVNEKEEQKELYDKLMLNEDRKIGAIGLDGWKAFFVYFGSGKFFALFLTIIIVWICMRTSSDFWLAYWSSNSSTDTEHTQVYYYQIFLILGLTSGFLVYVRLSMLFFKSLELNKRLHNEMFYKVIRAPINLFFDRVPMGRLINRFAADLNTFDFLVPYSLSNVLYLPFNLLSRFLICAFAGTMWVFPLAFIFFWIGSKVQTRYLDVYREVFRLSRITRSPVTSLFTESLDGLTHIRSSNSQDTFMRKYYNRQNENIKNEILISGLRGWFNFRINLASLLITGPCVVAAVIFSDNLRENSGMIGLLLSYLLDLNSNLITLLQMQNSFESNLISFERCKTFTTIDVEKDPETKLPLENYSYSWPERGKIEFKNYFTKYRPALPYVLKDVSLKVEGGQKIGVVGRTGSGKSTLFLSILRILEPQAGTIYIDDVDIAKVGLDDLRRKITTIPQVNKDPLLYKGTVKSNLDLLNEYDDNQIWGALEKVRMKNKFEQSGLGTEIKEGGENLSAGERQLLCIARAILKKNKIILIDEATSSIDNVTEEAILGAIHENFKDCTVITIAHRLKTIIEADKVLFMDNGQVLEFDTTKALLDNPESHFYHLWYEYQEAKAEFYL